MSVAGWSDPVGEVLWGGVLIFCTEVTPGNPSDRIRPYLKNKRGTDLAKTNSNHIT